jgi:hypothetical protein
MNAIESARTLLPWWVGWAEIAVYLPCAFLFSIGCSYAFASWALRPFLGQQSAGWVERARLAFPSTLLSQRGLLLFPALLGVTATAVHGPFTQIPLSVLALVSAAAAYLGAAWVAWRVQRRVRLPELSFSQWLRGNLSFCLIFTPHFLVVTVCAVVFPLEMTPAARVRAVAFGGRIRIQASRPESACHL